MKVWEAIEILGKEPANNDIHIRVSTPVEELTIAKTVSPGDLAYFSLTNIDDINNEDMETQTTIEISVEAI